MSEEEWKPVKGYKGFYEISSFGRVRSLSRKVKRSFNGVYSTPERILSSRPPPHYCPQVTLTKNGKNQVVRIKTLVAAAFLSNPQRRRFLVEIDGDKMNCRLDNLAWREVDKFYVRREGRNSSKDRPKLFFFSSDLLKTIRDCVDEWAAKNACDPRDAWEKIRSYRYDRIAPPEIS